MKILIIITMININLISITYWKGFYNEYKKKTIKSLSEQLVNKVVDSDFTDVFK